jgi:hypothetical protein
MKKRLIFDHIGSSGDYSTHSYSGKNILLNVLLYCGKLLEQVLKRGNLRGSRCGADCSLTCNMNPHVEYSIDHDKFSRVTHTTIEHVWMDCWSTFVGRALGQKKSC